MLVKIPGLNKLPQTKLLTSNDLLECCRGVIFFKETLCRTLNYLPGIELVFSNEIYQIFRENNTALKILYRL